MFAKEDVGKSLFKSTNGNFLVSPFEPTFLFLEFFLSKVLVEDLFGEAAKEREVEKIANKLPEAKTCKSFDTYEILAKFVGTRALTGLVSPLKEVGLHSNITPER